MEIDGFEDEGIDPDELIRLSKLTDPDAKTEHKYNWDENFQRMILGLLLNDKVFVTQCRDLINPLYFTDEVHQLVVRKAFEYLETHKVLPNRTIIIQEVMDAVASKDNKIKYHYIAETNLIYEKYIPGFETRDYLLEKVANFAKLHAVKNAVNWCLDRMKKNPEDEATWVEIQSKLRDALLVDRNFDIGLEYFQSLEERYARMAEKEAAQEFFTSGFKSIDDALLGGGPHRGEIYSWIGLSGAGKSLALVTAALRNVITLNKKVLYVSLEMDQDMIAERFDAQLSGAAISSLKSNPDVVKDAFEEFSRHREDDRLLVIKQFPAGSMGVNTLRAYLQQLYMTGFKPDLVIIDYIGEMKDYPNMPTWESRYRIVRDLRGLATEEDVCIFTAMQPNKSARDAQRKDGMGPGVIDDTNLADSYGQIRPLDGCWSLNQMQNEKEAGIGRVFVIKHRHGRSRFELHIQYNPQTLALTEISRAEYDRIWKQFMLTKEVRTSDLEADTYDKFKKGKKRFDESHIDPDQPD